MAPSEIVDLRTLEHLDPSACWALVGRRGIGRVGYMGATHLQIVPTKYDADRGVAFFRAGRFGRLAREVENRATSLQIDDIDAKTFVGWSVLISGTSRRVEDAATVAELWSLARPNPWSPGAETQWIELAAESIEGQRVSA